MFYKIVDRGRMVVYADESTKKARITGFDYFMKFRSGLMASFIYSSDFETAFSPADKHRNNQDSF